MPRVSNPRVMTTHALYVRHTVMLYLAYLCGSIAFLISMAHVLYPYYCDDLYKDVFSGFQQIENPLKTALLHHEYQDAYRIVEQMPVERYKSQPELHRFSLENYVNYGVGKNCKGTLVSFAWGVACLESSNIRLEIPVKITDNTLAHITASEPANIFFWAPFRMIVIMIFLALLTFTIFCIYLVRRFHRNYAIPIENVVRKFSEISTEEEAIHHLEEVPFKELHDLSRALITQATRLRNAYRMIHHLRLQAEYAQMSSQLSHDVKHQVCTIGLILDSAHINEGPKESIRKLLGKIHVNLDKKLREFKEIGFFSDTSTRQASRFNLVTTLEMILSEQRMSAQEKKVLLLVSIPTSLQAYEIEFDASDLDRVLLNIISNGIDAAFDNHENAVAQVYVTASLCEDACEIIVKDSGKGFRKDILEDVLSKRSATTKSTGHGIGLLSAQALIEKIGGQIHFHSDMHGTGVRIVVPIVMANVTPPSQTISESLSLK